MEDRALTFGEKLVGLSFNPSSDERVTAIKVAYAGIIDLLDKQRDAGEDARACSIAITKAQTAQMWAVKALFSK